MAVARPALLAAALALAGLPVGPAAAQAPPAPTLTAPAQVARGQVATVQGTAVPGSLVGLLFRLQGETRSTLRRELVADPTGSWSTTYVAAVDVELQAVLLGSAGAESPRSIVRAVGTTLRAPAVAPCGSTVAVSGTARPGSRVDVLFRGAGEQVFVDRRDLLPDAQGRWATTFVATRDQRLFARTTEAASPPALVQVACTSIAGPARVARGAVVTLTGRARPGARVGVHLRRAGTTAFVLRRRLTADARGVFRTTYVADASYAYYAVSDGVRSAVGSTAVVLPVRRPPAPRPPTTVARPTRDVDCPDFASWAQAQAVFNRYRPQYGDVFRLDADDDGIACESNPGAP